MGVQGRAAAGCGKRGDESKVTFALEKEKFSSVTLQRRCIMNGCGSFTDSLQAHALASASARQGVHSPGSIHPIPPPPIAPRDMSSCLNLYVFPGNAHGYFALAQMMRLGICGAQRDAAAAARHYAAAAQQQHAAACSNLGAMFEYGLGVKQDLTEALRLYVAPRP